jgi:hypothetical protein
MPLCFVPKVLSGNPSVAARARIDLSVRPSSFEIAPSEAPRRTLFLRTSSSAGLQGFPLDTIELHSRQKTKYSWKDVVLTFRIGWLNWWVRLRSHRPERPPPNSPWMIVNLFVRSNAVFRLDVLAGYAEWSSHRREGRRPTG